MANKTNTWTMNENQKAFLEALKEMGGSATLFELKLAGKEFKSGSINVLKAKGYVTVSEDKDDRVFECDVVYNGVKVGSVKKTGKVYTLVNQD